MERGDIGFLPQLRNNLAALRSQNRGTPSASTLATAVSGTQGVKSISPVEKVQETPVQCAGRLDQLLNHYTYYYP